MTSRSARAVAAGLVPAAIALGIAAGCTQSPTSALERLTESRRLAADLLLQLTKAADAANRAVMADTDEATGAFAQEARQATQAVESGLEMLAPMLGELGYTEETRLLEEFRGRFTAYTALDRRILELAVQNTNLKAQRLSFGPAQQAADSFRDAAESLTPSQPADSLRVEADVARAIGAVREVQVLQAPHIAEADDDVMTRLERRMATSQTAARLALGQVERRVGAASRPQWVAAGVALDRFDALNTEIVALSRRNSDVHSLALSLGQKRVLQAACEESVLALRDALARRGFAGTR